MKVYATIYRSFEGGFSIKVTTADSNTSSTNGKQFETVKYQNDNLILTNNVYLSFEDNNDYQNSASFTPVTFYKVKMLFKNIVSRLEDPNKIRELFDENGAVVLDSEGSPKQFTTQALGQKTITLSPANVVSADGQRLEMRIGMSLNGSDWLYMTIAECRGIYYLLNDIDLSFYQIYLGTSIALFKNEGETKTQPTAQPRVVPTPVVNTAPAATNPAPVQPQRGYSGVYSGIPAAGAQPTSESSTITKITPPSIGVVSNKKTYTPTVPEPQPAQPSVVKPNVKLSTNPREQVPVTPLGENIDELFD